MQAVFSTLFAFSVFFLTVFVKWAARRLACRLTGKD